MNLIQKMFYKKENLGVDTLDSAEQLTAKEIAIVEAIHADFDSAQDRLLDEAEQLLQELNIPTHTKLEEKAERLAKIGFINSEIVLRNNKIKKEIDKIQVKVINTQEFANLIKYYKQTYPFQKFLTEDELNRICQKYGLIYAPIANYCLDVPEKNIRDIENTSSLKKEDVFIIKFKLIFDNKRVQNLLSLMGHSDACFTQEEINNWCVKAQGRNVPEWTNSARETTWLYCVADKLYKNIENIYWDYKQVEKVDKSGLFIAAPQSHFNLKDVSQEEKYGFFKKTTVEIKDPIVFEYCRGGMIRVITKWGLEGNDELLTNPIEN